MKRKVSILSFVFIALLMTGVPVWAADFTISDPSPELFLTDTDLNEADWNVETDFWANEGFDIYNWETNTYPFIIENGAGNALLYLDAAEMIGINTSAPGYVLDVVGNSAIRLRNDTSATARTIMMRVDGSATDLYTLNTDLWIRSDTGTPYHNIYMNPSGGFTTALVGVGTTSPLQKLHVNGNVLSNGNYSYMAQSVNPGFWLDETGTGNKGLYYTLDGKVLQIQRRTQNFGAFEASIFKLYLDAPTNALFVKANGYIGFGRDPAYPIHSSTNAYLSAAGQWVNASSREYKENIKELTVDEAVGALKELNPITYTSKADPEDNCAGFIAEDVPEIVATKDRKGLSPMDIVAVLTKVSQEQQKTVQEQQKTISQLIEKVAELEKEVRWNKSHADISNLK